MGNYYLIASKSITKPLIDTFLSVEGAQPDIDPHTYLGKGFVTTLKFAQVRFLLVVDTLMLL
jgi:hypothetical protein